MSPSEAFLAVMLEQAGWAGAGARNRCNRCGGRDPGAVYVEWSLPVLLLLCDVCHRLVWIELWEQRRPALLAVYREALLQARLCAGLAAPRSGWPGRPEA